LFEESPVPLIVVICAGTISGRKGSSVGVDRAGPVSGVPGGGATYCSGSGGSSAVDASPEIPCFIVGLGVVVRMEHPAVLTSRMMRKQLMMPGLYIDNF